MNTGVISRRYATTLLKYVTLTGHGEEVYAQVKTLLSDADGLDAPLCEDLEQFTVLLEKNGRLPYVRLVFNSFLELYEKSRGIHVASLKTATGSPQLVARLQDFIRGRTDGTVQFHTETDPSLIGGFVLEMDGVRLDASVSHQLSDIRRELTEKNRRIV